MGLRFSAPQTHLWLIKVWFSASTFVVKITTFAKPETVLGNTHQSKKNLKISPKPAGVSLSRQRTAGSNSHRWEMVNRFWTTPKTNTRRHVAHAYVSTNFKSQHKKFPLPFPKTSYLC
jgi:hypothetical protein